MEHIDQRAIDTIRTLSADIVQKAKSGHPGAPMGMAAMAHVLFSKHLRFNPKNPKWVFHNFPFLLLLFYLLCRLIEIDLFFPMDTPVPSFMLCFT